MGIVDAVKGFLTGDPLKGIKGIIEEFHKRPMTPEEDLRLKELELKREELQQGIEVELAKVQGENIRAETMSEDAYVRRARPTFLYVMIAAIGFSLMVVPLINMISGQPPLILEIPDGYLQLFGVAFLGYVGARTWEKSTTKGK